MAPVFSLIIGSVAGGLSRYYLVGTVDRAMGTAFPYGTLAVNGIGCFLIGIFSAWLPERFGPDVKLLLMTGFCGAFTTFSAFILDTHQLLEQGGTFKALLNILLSVVLGFLLFRAGLELAKGI